MVPFLPLVNLPVALTGPPTLTLLAVFGHRPLLLTQVQVAFAVALASWSMLGCRLARPLSNARRGRHFERLWSSRN